MSSRCALLPGQRQQQQSAITSDQDRNDDVEDDSGGITVFANGDGIDALSGEPIPSLFSAADAVVTIATQEDSEVAIEDQEEDTITNNENTIITLGQLEEEIDLEGYVRGPLFSMTPIDAEVETVASTCTDSSQQQDDDNNAAANGSIEVTTSTFAIDPITGQSLPVATPVGQVDEEREMGAVEFICKGTLIAGIMFGFIVLFLYLIFRSFMNS